MKFVGFFTLLVTLRSLETVKAPSWSRPCPKSEPLSPSDCILKRINDALPDIQNGYAKYRIPSLQPLRLSSLAMDTGSGGKNIGLSLRMNDVEMWRMETLHYDKIKIDIARRSMQLQWAMDRLEILGDYVMDGKILILPIKGSGEGNITLTNTSGVLNLVWEWQEKNGKRYAKRTNSSMTFKVGHAYFNFKNLFNGDKTLGSQMNYFLNENWLEVVREFGPALGDAIKQVFQQITQNIFDLGPFDSFFPDK